MEANENCFQRMVSFYERIAKGVVIANLFVEIAFFITSCVLFMLFSTISFLFLNFIYLFKKIDKQLPNSDVYKGISLIFLFFSMLYFAYNSVIT